MQYNKFCCETVTQLHSYKTANVGVAQLDRAFGYGPKGRGFESSRPRLKALQREVLFFYFIRNITGGFFAGIS